MMKTDSGTAEEDGTKVQIRTMKIKEIARHYHRDQHQVLVFTDQITDQL